MRSIGRPKWSFWAKVIASVSLVALADQLFFKHGFGSTLSAFCLCWLAALILLRPTILRHGRAILGVAASFLLIILMFDHPSPIAWILYWIGLTVAALAPRSPRPGDAWDWTKAITAHGALSFAAGPLDLQRLCKITPPARTSLRSIVTMMALPLIGGALFVGLFASANPIIAGALSSVQLPELDITFIRMICWGVVFVCVWATFRPPRRLARSQTRPAAPLEVQELPGLTVGSVTLALIVFNALFAIENGLDIAFLWSGAALPPGMTLAEYAHRGAYPLIATALLAGGFSLVLTREGSETATRRTVRGLVGLWVLQNLMLCASSILRTVDYVEAYSLTRFRIAALLWMALVFFGLALIGWRLLRRKSRSWLINANAFALAAVLVFASAADFGEIAATWNVRHAKEAGGGGAPLDVCYLETLGPSALLPILEAEQRNLGPDVRARLARVEVDALASVEAAQQKWSSWTWRGERRLQAARAILADRPELSWPPGSCEPKLTAPPSTPPRGAADPLTSRAQR